MQRVGCLPMFVLYLAIGVGVISVGLNGLISIPLDKNGDYALGPDLNKLEERGHFLYLAASDGSSLMPLRTEVVSVTLGGRWSPDGKRLLHIIPADPTDLNKGGALFVTTDPQTPGKNILDVPGLIISPSFSPAGEKIAYIQAQGNNSGLKAFSLHVVEIEKPGESRLLLQPVIPYGPQLQWSPDGTELLAIIQTPSEEAASPNANGPLLEAEIIRVDVMTGAQTPVTRLFISHYEKPQDVIWYTVYHSMVWVPDHDMIIFSSFDPEYLPREEQSPPLLLYAYLLQEQRRIQLTEAPAPTEIPASYMLPTLSPSGSKLAYLKVWQDGEINKGFELFKSFRVSETPAFLSEIYVMDLASWEQQKVAGPGGLFQPFWAEENKLGYVEFAENVTTVWIQDLEKRTRHNLSSDLKTRFWEQRLHEAYTQLQKLKGAEALIAELEKLRGQLTEQLTEKEAQLQELKGQLHAQHSEIRKLKQRLEDKEDEIASLQRRLEAQRARPPRVEIILAISIALALLWRIFF